MKNDNVTPIGKARGKLHHRPARVFRDMGRENHDWQIRFMQPKGKSATKKEDAQLYPIWLLNTPEAEVARRLFQAEHLSTNKARRLTCEVYRFEGAKGWVLYPKSFLMKVAEEEEKESHTEERLRLIDEAAKELEEETNGSL
jgi:hypothetical protein